MSLVEDTSAAAIAAVLDQVGPRLKQTPHPTPDDPCRGCGDDRHFEEHAVAA